MNPAISRKLLADLKSNKLQFFLIGGVLCLSAMLLTVSLLVMGSADDPWDRTFEATNGPHLWVVSHEVAVDFSPLFDDPAVSEHTPAIPALAENPLVVGDDKINTFIYGMEQRPDVARPLLAEGRWLDSHLHDEVVLDFSLAKYYDFQIGDTVTFLGVDGNLPLKIVGLAVTAHWFPYDEITKDTSFGVAYVSQSTLEILQPDKEAWYSAVGVRLNDPESSKDMANRVFELFPGKLQSVIEWQFLKENSTLATTLNAMFMGLFSIIGLVAVGMIIFNTIGGQVLSQYREIGLLKAVGFKPRQVMVLFLFENLAIGCIAAVLGILLGLAVAPGLVGTMAENLNTTPPDIYAFDRLIVVFLLVEAAVALATILPAWQGSRIDTVQAISVGYLRRAPRASMLGRLALWLRVPVLVALGVKDTFSRPLRAVLAITSLLLTVMIVMTAVGAQTTVDHLAESRFYSHGTSADMKVMRNFVPYDLIADKILTSPEIINSYQEAFVWGQIPDRNDQPLGIRLLTGNYRDFDFQIKEGRMIAAPGEAVMGYAVLELMDANVGDTVDLLVEGKPIRVTIVGRHTENFNLNKVIIADLETYQAQAALDIEPTTFYLRLDDYSQAESLRRQWLDDFQGWINVSVVTEEPVSSMVQLKNLIVSLAGILLIVAGTNLMSTSLLSIRERVRDFGIQKTLGVTPGQIGASVVIGAVTLVVIALLVGVTLGMEVMERFIQQVGISIGAGPDFYLIDWGAISLLLPLLALVAIISSLLPAVRAAKLKITDALRYE